MPVAWEDQNDSTSSGINIILQDKSCVGKERNCGTDHYIGLPS